MNKQSLYLVGGALLASTSLTAVGHAATIRSSNGAVGTNPSAVTAKGVATQVFSANTTVANAVTLGGGAVTANSDILVDIASTFVAFDLKLDISSATAAFSTTTPTLVFYTQSTSGSITAVNTSVTGCAAQVSSERISLLNCNPTGQSNFSRVDAVAIRGVTFTSATSLRTAGTSISLSGGVFQASTASTFESINPATVVTSKSVTTDFTVQAGTNAAIDNNASPAFTLLVSSGVTTSTTAQLGSVHFSTAAAVGTDLSNVFTALASVVSTAEVKISHSVLSDRAFTKLTLGGLTRIPSDVVSGSVSFQLAGASLNASPIVVSFNGTTAISSTTGSPSATVTPTAGGATFVALSAVSGALATLTRGGLNVEVNTVLPSSLQRSYISFLRIANQGAEAAVATLVVRNDSTGAVVGTITTDSIPAGGVGQINSLNIDTKLTTAGVTPLEVPYKVTVSGNFNGYVQSLLYNVASQVFADASGFRNGALTSDP